MSNDVAKIAVLALAIISVFILANPAYASNPTFVSVVNLSNNPGGSFEPSIAVSGNNIYLIWRDDTPGNDEIFFSTSNDNGAT
ncbi:MAG: hypothetical protein ACE5J2_00915, partial [Nitrososphaerales archaeon]